MGKPCGLKDQIHPNALLGCGTARSAIGEGRLLDPDSDVEGQINDRLKQNPAYWLAFSKKNVFAIACSAHKVPG